jgi:TRAP-type C4-dicarboxylate transport system permease small subunit
LSAVLALPAGGVLRAARGARKGIAWGSMMMARLAGWNYVACALFITLDVLCRNFLGVSSSATVEVTGYMLAGGIAWSLGHALAERAHIRVDVLANRMPVAVRAWLHLVSLALLAVFAGFITWAAWHLVSESVMFDAHDNTALRVPLVVPQSIWAVGITAFMAMVVALLAEAVLTLVAGRGAELDQLLCARGFQEETQEALEAVGMAREGTAR